MITDYMGHNHVNEVYGGIGLAAGLFAWWCIGGTAGAVLGIGIMLVAAYIGPKEAAQDAP